MSRTSRDRGPGSDSVGGWGVPVGGRTAPPPVPTVTESPPIDPPHPGPRWSLAPVDQPAASPTAAPLATEPSSHPPPPRMSRGRRLSLLLRVAAGALAVLLAVMGALTAYAAFTLPSIDGLGQATGTIRFLDRHGAVIAEVGHDERARTTVPLSAVAPVMQDATLAAEDRDFYGEGAVNYTRVLHALVIDVLAGSAEQGASTITQQLAKLAFLSPDPSPLRKLREALLANQIGQRYTKPQILELYLNLINYGNGAYGVEDAAQRYFGVHARDLDLRQASLLAGLPQAPAANDPLTNPDNAFARQHYVLSGLVTTGRISMAQAAQVDPLAPDPAARNSNQAAVKASMQHGHPAVVGAAPHFVSYVRGQLDSLLAGLPSVLDGNLDVTTTLDLGIQQQAEAAVRDGVVRLGRGANNGALLMLDPTNGDILAMVGSADFGNAAIAGQYNVVTGARRPGSSFKPIVYAEAFAEGQLKPGSMLDDTAAESARLGGVQNADGRFLGRISVRDALLGSRNVPAEQAMQMAGVAQVIDLAHRMGITTDLAPNANTAIGSSAVRMVDLGAAYSVIAAGGRRVIPRAVTRVADGSGGILIDSTVAASRDQVLPQAVTGQLTDILRDYPAHWGLPFDRPTAGKSGTTDGNVDAWYVAYTAHWVVATWVGHTDGASVAEVGMDGVVGSDVGRAVTAPFVAKLARTDAGFPGRAAATPTPTATCHGDSCQGG